MTAALDARHALNEADRCLQCFDAPCTAACPAHIDIPRFIYSLRTGNLRGAARVVRHANAMAHVCGNVCPEEVFCQATCTRGKQDRPVEIRGLHRYVTAVEAERGTSMPHMAAASGKRVAVIGAGPAGLTCAFELGRFGIATTVFERSVPGGVPAASIPAYRLPEAELQVDREFLLKFFHLERSEVTPAAFERLRKEFNAVFVGVGLGLDRMPSLPGNALRGVLPVLGFLESARRLPGSGPPGRRVVVIGGGNVSLDAAATARRQGAERVVLLYRRGEQEMRVWKAELEEARKSGVEIRCFAQPVEILGERSVSGMLCRQTRLGDTSDATGRRIPVEIPGSEFRLEADAVIVAIGQVPAARFIDALERTSGGYVKVDRHYETSIPGVFAGGDVVGGEGTIVQAVAQGKAAAKCMQQHLDREP